MLCRVPFTFANEIIQDDRVCFAWDLDLTLKRPSQRVHVSRVSAL